MPLELKGMLAGILAALFVVGAAYGVSTLVTAGQSRGLPKQIRAASSIVTPLAQTVPSQIVTTGQGLFARSCASCHGAQAQGAYGPNLHHEDLTDPQITLKIANGIPGKMPAFARKYSASQIQTLVAYIHSLK